MGVIGILDSGVGGLSVLREIRSLLPEEVIAYVGDSAFCPYGSKPGHLLRERVSELVEFLLARGAKLIVLACNSATIQAIHWCRQKWPEVTFVGMEPGVKPAVKASKNQIIGVLATEASLTGQMFRDLVQQHGKNCQVLTRACPKFVELVEEGCLAGPEVERAAKEYADPLISKGADVLVLGCTHYPFLKPELVKLYPEIEFIDTGAAVARQVKEVLRTDLQPGSGQVSLWSSGEVVLMAELLPILVPGLMGEILSLQDHIGGPSSL